MPQQVRPPDQNTNWAVRALVGLMIWMTVSNTLFQWFGKPYQESWWLTSMISAGLLAVIYTSYEGRRRAIERRVQRQTLQRAQRILLVEDSPFAQSLIRRILQNQDEYYELDVAPSAEHALKMLRRDNDFTMYQLPDQILLDLTLPGMTGAEFLDTIKHDPALNWIPVTIFSAQKIPDAGDVIMASTKAWAAAWVEKGEGPDAVMDAIKDAADIAAVTRPQRLSRSGGYPAKALVEDRDRYDVKFTPEESEDDDDDDDRT